MKICNFAKELKGESTDQFIATINRLNDKQKLAILETEGKAKEARNLLQEIIDSK